MVKIDLSLFSVQSWFDGSPAGLVEVAKVAEEFGIDQVGVTDHVVMDETLKGYPFGKFPVPLDFEWYEPMAVLSAIAASTSRVLLGTGILIGPLRSAALLAKQIATLDCLSNGRARMGLGVGWQEAEYSASGIPFESRYSYLMEQVEAMRALWRAAPASFTGELIKFSGIHARPFPVQGDRVPIIFGIPPTERNIERIAVHADGWMPLEIDPLKLAPVVASLRQAFVRHQRDPASLVVRAPLDIFKDGKADLEVTLAGAQAMVDAGVNELHIRPIFYCRDFSEFPHFCDRLVALRESLS